MAITHPRVKRGQFEIRESASWGADSGAWTYMKLKEQTMPPGLDYVEGDDITQYDAEDVGSVLLAPGDVTLRSGLHPAVSEWPAVKPIIGNLPPIYTLLKSLMGTATAGGYGVTTTGNTASVLQFDSYDTLSALGYLEGDLVYLREPGAAGIIWASAIADVDDLNFQITLRHPVAAAACANGSEPADETIVYGGFNVPKITTDVSVPLDLRWTGEAAYIQRKALSCLPSAASISAPHRGLAELSMTFRSALPAPPDASESGGGVSLQTYSYPETSQVIKGGLYHWDGSTNRKLTGGMEIDFGVELSEVGGVNAVDPLGIAAFVLTARKIRVRVSPAMNSDAYALWDIFQNPPTTSILTGWWGIGQRVSAFQIPQAAIVSVPSESDGEGKVMIEAEFGASPYTGDTGSPSGSTGVDAPFVLGSLAGAAS